MAAGQDALYNARIMEAAEAGGGEPLEAPDLHAHKDNPFCGDEVTVDLALGADGRITAVHTQARGCLLVRASAHFLSEQAPGADPAAIAQAGKALKAMLRGEGPAPDAPWEALAVFEPLQQVKSRHGCALLPFEAVERELKKRGGGT